MRESERGLHVFAVLIGVNLDGAVVPAHHELSHPVARDIKVVETLDRPVLPLALHRPLHLWSLPEGKCTELELICSPRKIFQSNAKGKIRSCFPITACLN